MQKRGRAAWASRADRSARRAARPREAPARRGAHAPLLVSVPPAEPPPTPEPRRGPDSSTDPLPRASAGRDLSAPPAGVPREHVAVDVDPRAEPRSAGAPERAGRLRRREAHREALERAQRGRRRPRRGRARELDRRETPQQRLEGDPPFHAGDARAQAE